MATSGRKGMLSSRTSLEDGACGPAVGGEAGSVAADPVAADPTSAGTEGCSPWGCPASSRSRNEWTSRRTSSRPPGSFAAEATGGVPAPVDGTAGESVLVGDEIGGALVAITVHRPINLAA
jgi:hypothetical protein